MILQEIGRLLRRPDGSPDAIDHVTAPATMIGAQGTAMIPFIDQ